MGTKANAIITACDARYGDFLARHWLRSLRENVDLRDIDVIVLDFGLESKQRAELEGAVLVPARREGRINVARRLETARFLRERDYDQVLTVDGGDVIFQKDVSHLFARDKDSFRGVQERYPIPLGFFLRGAPRPLREEVRTRLGSRYMINGGGIWARSCPSGAAVPPTSSMTRSGSNTTVCRRSAKARSASAMVRLDRSTARPR